MFFAVDERKTAAVIRHHGCGVITAVNNAQNKLFIGIGTVKETLNAH